MAKRAEKGCTDGTAQAVARGYLRKQEAARYLGIAVRTLTDWMNEGIVPYIRIKHTPLFRITDLDATLNGYRHAAVGEQ